MIAEEKGSASTVCRSRRVPECIYIYIYVCMYVCMHVCMYVCMYLYYVILYIHMSVYVHMIHIIHCTYIYIYIYKYINKYIYMYTHTWYIDIQITNDYDIYIAFPAEIAAVKALGQHAAKAAGTSRLQVRLDTG